jgi:large subunit ribosomal protein L31e
MAEAKDAGKGSGVTQGERIMNVPLRKEWLKSSKNRRGNRAVSALRTFVSRHTKSHDVKISQKVNERIWIRGAQKPPQSIKVKVDVSSDGVVSVRLPEEKELKSKKGEKKGRLEQMKETLERDKGLPLGGRPKQEILRKGKKRAEERPGPEEGEEAAKEAEAGKPGEAPKEAEEDHKKPGREASKEAGKA